MLNVICVRVGQKYTPDYVYKLKNMVSRHLEEKHRFLCMTDNAFQVPGIDTIMAPVPIADSWCKIGLFASNLMTVEKGERCLYLDLDVVITGSLDQLIKDKLKDEKAIPIVDKLSDVDINQGLDNKSNELWIAKDWHDPFNSSVMYWVHGQQSKIYGKFRSEDMNRLRGDQNLISELVPDAKTFNKSDILSYKFSGLMGKEAPPKNAKVVLFHGKPKMHELNVDWINKEWI